MKNIIISAWLLVCGLLMFSACADDRDSNPVLPTPTTFVLNTPPAAANTVYDLAHSTDVVLTCTQPNYGFPAHTGYQVEVSLNSDMSDAITMSETYYQAKLKIDARQLAATITQLEVNKGKLEKDFPLTVPVYIRLHANLQTALGDNVPNTGITSNVIKLDNVKLHFSLPPVLLPEHVYINGNFGKWDWGNSIDMVPVNGTDNMFWHLVYIDEAGIKLNINKAWDGKEVGYAQITAEGDLQNTIQANKDGNISSTQPGWYLVVVTLKVEGRKLAYNIMFNKPSVYLMGPVTQGGAWAEEEAAARFTVPTTADGEFVSPAFAAVPAADQGLRAYVKVPNKDWWRTEFMVFDKKIVYRANGGDQERIVPEKGQKLYLNFTNETGYIK